MWRIMSSCLPRRWIEGLVMDPDVIQTATTRTAERVQKVGVNFNSRALFYLTTLWKSTAAAY